MVREQYDRDDLVHKILYEVGKAAAEMSQVAEMATASGIAEARDDARAYLRIHKVAERACENMRIFGSPEVAG